MHKILLIIGLLVIPSIASANMRFAVGGKLDVTVQTWQLQSVAPGATRIPMMSLTFKAPCTEDVTVYDIEVQRRGHGIKEEIEGIYLAEKFQRITRARTVDNRNHTATLNPRQLTIPACGSRTVELFMDLRADSNPTSRHTFALRGVNASMPVRIVRLPQNTLTAQRTSGPLKGELAIDYLNVTGSAKVGQKSKLGKFRITASGRRRASVVTAITVTNIGTADDGDVRKLSLWAGTRFVSSTVDRTTNNQVRFEFPGGLEIKPGRSRIITLYGIPAARGTFRAIIEEPSDVEHRLLRTRR